MYVVFHEQSESEVRTDYFVHPGDEIKENRPIRALAISCKPPCSLQEDKRSLYQDVDTYLLYDFVYCHADSHTHLL